jgi:hypothetical protein
MEVVSLTPRPLYPQGKSHWYSLVGGWVGPRAVLDTELRVNVSFHYICRIKTGYENIMAELQHVSMWLRGQVPNKPNHFRLGTWPDGYVNRRRHCISLVTNRCYITGTCQSIPMHLREDLHSHKVWMKLKVQTASRGNLFHLHITCFITCNIYTVLYPCYNGKSTIQIVTGLQMQTVYA